MNNITEKRTLLTLVVHPLASIQRWMRPHGWWMLALIAMAAVLFGRTLFSTSLMISAPGEDGSRFFYYVHTLAREGFSNGELVTWDPYIFCGTPVTGTFQYALLYPPHWLCALLPPMLSMNWLMFLHVCLAGLGTYGWCVFRGLKPGGAFMSGMVYMLSGAFIAHVYAGHFTLVYAGAWIPIVFWGIDGWMRHRRARWLLLASGAAAAQVYSGYPQLFYYTALAAGLYSLTGLFFVDGFKGKIKTALGLLAIYPLSILLAAAELLPGWRLTSESARATGLSYGFGGQASMQFKNLLLLLSPSFYGNVGNQSFWDNEFLHETLFYCGLGGLLLAIAGWWGMTRGRKIQYAVLVAVFLLFSLGVSVPHFYIFSHDYIPLYGSFRGPGRFIIIISLLVALLAGTGLSRLHEGRGVPRGLAWGALGVGGVMLVAGLLLYWGMLGGAYHALASWVTTQPGYRQNLSFADRQGMAETASAASLCWSGFVMMALGILLWLVKRKRRVALALFVAVSVIEMMVFDRTLTPYFETKNAQFPEIAQYTGKYSAGDRSLNTFRPNANLLFKSENIWGYDGVLLRRTLEYIEVSQGRPPGMAIYAFPPVLKSRMFALLRGRYALVQNPSGKNVLAAPFTDPPMPRFSVIGRYYVDQDRNKILGALKNEKFDYQNEVILEKYPQIPESREPPKYTVRTRLSSLNRWEIEVETSAPGILLMTDSYATGWHARALPGSVQTSYDLQPADWALRGIPLLKSGKHIIEINYTPPGLALGLGVSLATLAALAVCVAFALRRRAFRPPLRSVVKMEGEYPTVI